MAHGLLYGASFTKGVLSFTDKQGRTICNADFRNYLTLTATSDNSSVKLTMVGTLSNKFEVNVGNGWKGYNFGTVIPLKAGQSCKWRCSAHPTTQSARNYVKFVMTGTIEASGNCNSMLNSDFENLTSLTGYDYAFCGLFRNCTSLTKAPILPATILASSCYASMFSECTSLVNAHELPATTLASSCYTSMFYECKSLVIAPELPATTLSENCYRAMFYGCEALTQAPSLPATTLANSCYYDMFRGCIALTRSPELPATTLESFCYYFMFSSCASLTQAPSLPATTLANFCYYNMFNGCSKLKEVRIAATTTTATNALNNWLDNVSATGNFYCDPSVNYPTGASGIPEGWTRLPLSDYPTT